MSGGDLEPKENMMKKTYEVQAVALFQAIDSMVVDRFLEFLTPDAEFTFGSNPGVKGREAIGDYIAQFFKGIAGMHHELLDIWHNDGVLLVRQAVTYTRLDQSRVTLPCMNVMRTRDGLIYDYRIFIDVNPLFA